MPSANAHQADRTWVCYLIRIETTWFWGSQCGCFGAHPSVITVFTPDQMNCNMGGNKLEFDSNWLKPVGLKMTLELNWGQSNKQTKKTQHTHTVTISFRWVLLLYIYLLLVHSQSSKRTSLTWLLGDLWCNFQTLIRAMYCNENKLDPSIQRVHGSLTAVWWLRVTRWASLKFTINLKECSGFSSPQSLLQSSNHR